MVSLGYVLMKKGISWIGQRAATTGYYRNLSLWLAGFLLMSVSIVPGFFALRVIATPIVAAVHGLNVVFTVYLSAALLGERVLRTDYLYSSIISAAIGLLQFVQAGASGHNVNWTMAVLFTALPIMAFGAFGLAQGLSGMGIPQRLRAVLLAFLGGGMGGFTVVLLRIWQLEAGMELALYAASPVLYMYAAIGILSFVALQLAYRSGDMVTVSPVQYSSAVFYPFISSFPIFTMAVHPAQVVLAIVIIAAVVKMTLSRGTASAASGQLAVNAAAVTESTGA